MTLGRAEMSDWETAGSPMPTSHVWGLWALAAVLTLCGLGALYQTVIVWSYAGPVVVQMPARVWLSFGLAGLYGPLFLISAWFCARRSRYAVPVYGFLALLWLASNLTNFWQQGWRTMASDALPPALIAMVITVLPWFYLSFLRSRNWLS